MKIINIRPQQKLLKVILDTECGQKIELYKFGKSIICPSPPEGLYKESKNYLALKKACEISDYFNSDLHLTVRQKCHIFELKQILKIFIGVEL